MKHTRDDRGGQDRHWPGVVPSSGPWCKEQGRQTIDRKHGKAEHTCWLAPTIPRKLAEIRCYMILCTQLARMEHACTAPLLSPATTFC